MPSASQSKDMSSAFTLSEATSADAHAIASLFSLSWTSPFTQLQFGHVDPPTLADAMAPRIEQHMAKGNVRFVIMRHPETSEVVAVAQWALPLEDDVERKKESPEQRAEREAFEDESYRNRLPENSNKELIMDFTIGLRRLREDVLKGRKHYLLENLATHPDHRGKGLASRLIEWIFPQADAQDVVVYLDTASDNSAMRLYKRLGFEEKGSRTIEDLGKYGGHGSETHVALLRYPKHSS